jgi:hypothetical protein
MNQPTSNHPMVGAEQCPAPTPPFPTLLPFELLDACGNGYTAADLARALAARTRATSSTEAG